jgi:thiosulfate/3-mercaptopyruvate sulfurtransferase
LLGAGDVAILDTRSDDEYLGKNVRAARGGTIPGAIHIEWTHNLQDNGTFKPAEALRALYVEAGITAEKTVLPF